MSYSFIFDVVKIIFTSLTIVIYILGYRQITKNKTINSIEKFLWFLVVLFFNFVGLLLFNIYLQSIENKKM